MSRTNKVNPDHYKLAGRLSPDDLARERVRQGDMQRGPGRERNKPTPPWMAKETAASSAQADTGASREGKGSGAGTPATGKSPRPRGSAARVASPQRAGRPGAQAAASRGRQKVTAAKGGRRPAKSSGKR
jgi:hypothetical protein